MTFINHWWRALALPAGADSLALDLPDGTYRLTWTDAVGISATRWEIVEAVVAAGEATLTRGLEGTDDQEWSATSIAYCDLTAGTLNSMLAQLADLQARVAALESGGIPDGALVDGAGNYLVDDQGNYLTGV